LTDYLVTTLIGMGVTFTALAGLSIYIEIFRKFTGRYEAGGAQRRAAAESRLATPRSGVASARGPSAEGADEDADEDARAAAVIAVSLHLRGVLGDVSSDTVVAIATALELERRRRYAMLERATDASWRLAARSRAMGALQRGQDMRGAWSRAGVGR